MSQIEVLQAKIDQARNELKKVIIGQEEIVDSLFLVLLTRGHALLIGVPGLAKTLMVYSLAKVFDGSFNRVQFTPDLMPSDITGVDLIQENPKTGKKEFKFIKGPIFCNILLA
ncbi:AAA family ATPase, partial [bacterium]|nr:AAA family ATPase [bacterium]